MKMFMKFAISLFVLCLVVFTFAYFLGPNSVRESIRANESSVGQLNTENQTTSPMQPAESK